MKNNLVYILGLSLVLLTVLFSACKPNDLVNPKFPTYDYTIPVVNPPDEFEILFNVSLNGNQIASVTFQEDANDTSNYIIASIDTIGLQGGYTYKFVANNNNYPDFYNFFTHYTKLGIEYDSFEPKF